MITISVSLEIVIRLFFLIQRLKNCPACYSVCHYWVLRFRIIRIDYSRYQRKLELIVVVKSIWNSTVIFGKTKFVLRNLKNFIQKEKVTDIMKAGSLVAYFTTGAGEKISFDVPIVANSWEEAPKK